MILGADSLVAEEEVVRSVKCDLEGLNLDGKDADRSLVVSGDVFEVVRKIVIRAGRHNWLLDMDKESFDYLLTCRKICIDMKRYRIAEYISIVRCYKCQAFGHVANRYAGDLKCVKCAEQHIIKDCTVDTVTCSNCFFRDDKIDDLHRADSPYCPSFRAYMVDLIAKRM